ncbi:MAG TPA: exodeoxyribonuclease VII small subunit [Polyangiaceae bacterium]|jgi:exodeoxyribonuclease VII small subunit|nr:exodeoxyribonuclease VII small subunit [Polyangiaceae bacterium]
MTRTKAETRAPEANGSTNEALASFEGTLERLHEIVERLEGGELDLEESLRLFEEGVRLSRASQARLNSAEKRVEELLAVDANGDPITRELDVLP